jgi:enoyl-CoA hydratase/carnithine racemase
MDRDLALAKDRANKSIITLQVAKQVVNQGLATNLPTGLLLEKFGQSFIFGTQDRIEGITALLEKRPPNFKCK